jgi:hypothetical protein
LISAVVITEMHELDPHLDDWDRLAVLRGQPYSAPAWMLAWWRQHRRRRRRLAERGAEFRLVGPDDDPSAPIASFIALTIERWVLHLGADRGPEGIRGMLLEAAADLVPRGRMRTPAWRLSGSPCFERRGPDAAAYALLHAY